MGDTRNGIDEVIAMQSRWESIRESVLNTASGFIFSWCLTMFILPWGWGFPADMGLAAEITTLYTAASIGRNYVWRRIFNRKVRASGGVIER